MIAPKSSALLRYVLLRGLLFLGIAVNVGFLLINLQPDRPHLGARLHGKVLLRVNGARARWVAEHQLAEFSATHDIDLEVVDAGAELRQSVSALLAALDP